MKTTTLIATLAALAVTPVLATSGSTSSSTAGATASTSMSTKMTAPMFVQMAAMSDMFEIQSSKAALQKAQSADVKRFAQMMVDHHTKMSANLKAAVQQGKVDATIPTALAGEKAKMVQSMSSLSGAESDRMYMQAQVQSHQEALALMKGYAQNGDNAALKQFAQQGTPIVQEHLDMAQKMSKTS